MKIGDKVKSHVALWRDCEGTIIGIVDIGDSIIKYVHVLFPETDKHEAFQQSFYSNNLIITNEKK